MAKHVWERNLDGTIKTIDSDNYPYCFWVVCRECDGWFCDNGCDPGFEDEECPVSDLRLFDVDRTGTSYDYFE